MSYQQETGPLMANSHPGSYCGQDAYSDMFVTEKRNGILHRERTSASATSATQCGCAELYARSADNPQMWGVLHKVKEKIWRQ